MTGTRTQAFGRTQGYANENLNDINPCQLGICDSYCTWCVDPAATAECTLTGAGGNLLRAIGTRVDDSLIQVQLDTIAYNPCEIEAPAIDAHLTFEFRQIYDSSTGALGPMEWRLVPDAKHDGFPWHELYLNGAEVYRWDPCPSGPSPLSLFGDGDVKIIEGEGATAPDLAQWQLVPGQ